MIQDNSTAAILDTANEWAVRMHAPDLTHAEKVAFSKWLRASPIHVREYLKAEALRVALRDSLHGDSTDIEQLLGELSSNVVPLEMSTRKSANKIVRVRRGARFAALAAMLIAGAGMALALYTSQLTMNGYSSDVGEVREIALPDGSRVELNTGSKIRVDFKDDLREIHLTRGEAFFTVAKDTQRPFRVVSDTVVVRAIGTQFSVYRKPDGIVVTVLEGKVAAQDEKKTIELVAGQQLMIEPEQRRYTALAEAKPIDAERATAWRQHRLIFDNQPLSEVVAEFNRYNRQQLIIDDPALAAQGISGVFDPEKPQGLLLFLDRKGGIHTVVGAGNTLILSR